VKPTFSIIFFTVSSGAGLGLLALLALVDVCPAPLLSDALLFWGIALALLLIVAGLTSSVFHLANPSNAWRAFSRFRTSWLSREAVFSALLVPLALVYAAIVWTGGTGSLRTLLSLLVIALAWTVMVCTAMIYASLKPIRQWHTRWTPTNYVLLGHWSGAIILLALLRPSLPDSPSLLWTAAALGVVGLAAKLGYWRAIADASGAPTIERAIGVREGVRPPAMSVAQARLFDAGHSHRTFLTDEFVFKIARERASTLRIVAIVLAFVLPALWLFSGMRGYTVAVVVAVLCLAGLLVERWLFFAEARHTVRLYHGDRRT
jgi:DMSO reductase anchor subunit